MSKVPQSDFQEGFYIWFDTEKREEYYATPLYLYNIKEEDFVKSRGKSIYLERPITSEESKKITYKNAGTIHIPYADKFGTMLLRFVNADFSTCEQSYNTFFYAYGYELIREYVPYNCLRTDSEVDFIEVIQRVFENSKNKLQEMQNNYRECVEFVFNINNDNDYIEYKPNAMFIGYSVKNYESMYTYSNNIEVSRDNYSLKASKFKEESLQELIKNINENISFVPFTNIYTSSKLSNILYVILEELTKTENNPIKKCKNCGKYFIPVNRLDEVYCEYPNENGLTCREIGAGQTYKKNLENIPALLEYRRSYQKKIMVVSRNKEDKQLRKDFDKWKKQAQEKIKQFKQGKIEETVLYEWIIGNK